MKRCLFTASLGATAVLGITVQPVSAQMMCSMMGHGDESSRADMHTVMQLFADHSAIRRRVEPIPGGVRAVTESDDPRIAALLQSHVGAMYRRIDEGRRFTMMSRTLPAMFDSARRYHRVLSLTQHGVSVVETPSDTVIAKLIRAHAVEVSGFVADGMRSMCDMMGP